MNKENCWKNKVEEIMEYCIQKKQTIWEGKKEVCEALDEILLIIAKGQRCERGELIRKIQNAIGAAEGDDLLGDIRELVARSKRLDLIERTGRV